MYDGPTAISKDQVTALTARLFGTWTLLAGIIQIYAAYRINNEDWYTLALWTYVIALDHFSSEWLIFGTMRPAKGLLLSSGIATGSLVWMLSQWGSYVK